MPRGSFRSSGQPQAKNPRARCGAANKFYAQMRKRWARRQELAPCAFRWERPRLLEAQKELEKQPHGKPQGRNAPARTAARTFEKCWPQTTKESAQFLGKKLRNPRERDLKHSTAGSHTSGRRSSRLDQGQTA